MPVGEDFTIYDGYVEFEYTAYGDIWISFDFVVLVPKLAPSSSTGIPCTPSTGASPVKVSLPRVTIQTSLLIQNDLGNEDGNGELLILAAIESIELTIKVITIELGAGIGMLRVRSADPDCLPSGIFVSGTFNPQLQLGEGFKDFLQLPQLEKDIQFGVTWKDRGLAGPEDFVQSFFFRMETSFEFLGISVGSVTMEIQFFNEDEFVRRRDYDKSVCCVPAKGITNCEIPNSALDTFLSRDDVTPGPTFGLFLTMQDISFFGSK